MSDTNSSFSQGLLKKETGEERLIEIEMMNNPPESVVARENIPRDSFLDVQPITGFAKEIKASEDAKELVKVPDAPAEIEAEEEEKPSLVNSIYAAYIALLVPVSASLTGLTDTEQLLHGKIPDYTKNLFIILLVISSVLASYLIGIQIYINKKYEYTIPKPHKKKFIILWLILAVGFGITSGFSFKDYSYIFKQCPKQYQQIWDQNAVPLYENAVSMLCTSKCPCDLKFPALFSQTLQAQLAPYISTTTGSINISGCPNFEGKTELYYQLKQAEDFWGCTGVCKTLDFYYLTDVNKGPPTDKRPCLQVAIQDYLPQINNLIKYSALFSIIVHFIIIISFYAIETDTRIKPEENKYSSGSGSSSSGSGSGSGSGNGANGAPQGNENQPNLAPRDSIVSQDFHQMMGESTMQGAGNIFELNKRRLSKQRDGTELKTKLVANNADNSKRNSVQLDSINKPTNIKGISQGQFLDVIKKARFSVSDQPIASPAIQAVPSKGAIPRLSLQEDISKMGSPQKLLEQNPQ